MKHIFTILSLVASSTICAQADTDIVNIPDAAFKAVLISNPRININQDGEISYGEAKAYTHSISVPNIGINDITGIEAFINLTRLNVSGNQLKSLDVSKNTELKHLSCDNNQLTNINTNGASNLNILYCKNNQFTVLDVSYNENLRLLDCEGNPLERLDISNTYVSVPSPRVLPTLKHLKMRNNKNFYETFYYGGSNLETLDVSGVTIRNLNCSGNKLTHLDVTDTIGLGVLNCSNNQLTNLDVSQNKNLTSLSCNNNQLANLITDGAAKLSGLSCNNNQLANLNLSNNLELAYLYCSNNQLVNLEIGNNQNLKTLDCSGNQLVDLDVSQNKMLETLRCSNNNLTVLDIRSNKAIRELKCANNPQLSQLFLNYVSGNHVAVDVLDATNNPSLFCIHVGPIIWGGLAKYTWKKDNHTEYRKDCNYSTLSITEVNAENDIQILNPMKDKLFIKTTAKVEKIELYNAAGQLVKTLQGNQRDVSTLQKGTYLLKVTTANGTQTLKAIKQ